MASGATVLPRLPRVRDTLEVLPASDSSVYVLRPGTDQDLVIGDAGPETVALLAGLDGGRSVEAIERDLARRFPELDPRFVRSSVAQLHDLGLVEDAATDREVGLSEAELDRYDRQLAYFGDVMPAKAARTTYQRRLKDAHVVVLGLGGLGSWTLYALACAGVGRIDGVDHDAVERVNLNRQILYSLADIGAPKAEAAARRIRAYNPDIDFRPRVERVASEADVDRLVEGADFVVAAADWPPHLIERWVNDVCFARGIPYISMGQFPPRVRVGPTYVPGLTGCYRCSEATYREQFPLFDELAEARSRHPTVAATFAPCCALIGAVVSADVVHHLTGLSTPATLGAALIVDMHTMEQTREPVPSVAGCPACGGLAAAG